MLRREPKRPIGLSPGPQATLAIRGKTVPVFVFLLAAEGSRKQDTYSHDEEVQPAPGIGEELDEAIGCPLEQHLQDEDVGEDFISVLQDGTDGLPLLDVDVLKGLEERQQLPIVPTEKQATRKYHPAPPQPLAAFPPVLAGHQLPIFLHSTPCYMWLFFVKKFS